MSVKAKMAESGDLEDGDLELPEEEEDEEGLIRYYFFKGFVYKEIRLFLFKNHGIEMTFSTGVCKIRKFGIRNPESVIQKRNRKRTATGVNWETLKPVSR